MNTGDALASGMNNVVTLPFRPRLLDALPPIKKPEPRNSHDIHLVEEMAKIERRSDGKFKPIDAQPRRHCAAAGTCAICDAACAKDVTFHPPHDPSPRCESGKRAHCSCDICF